MADERDPDVVVGRSARNRFPGHRDQGGQGQGDGAGRDPGRARTGWCR